MKDTNQLAIIVLKALAASLAVINGLFCATIEVTSYGPGVLDLPMTFTVKLTTQSSDEKFWYIFEDRGVYPRHREEVIGGREANYTIVYQQNETQSGTYSMRVQVLAYVYGFKGWLLAEDNHQFDIKDGLSGDINLSQLNVTEKALKDGFVATNKSVQMTSLVDSSHFPTVKDSVICNYTWVLDGRTFDPNLSPILNYNFTSNQTYTVSVLVICTFNMSYLKNNITKFGHISRVLKARNEIKQLNINGNTWLLDGALLQLQVNCTGGDGPYWYCYEFSKHYRPNYTCSKEVIRLNQCYFPIIHYFPKNGTYFIDIAVYNDIYYVNKTIKVNVYEIVRQTQLSFVIIPVVSSILAIVILVVGMAYHLQQRASHNITLEVADFDFQNNDSMIEQTFFERLRATLATAMRDTFLYPCNPCTRPQDCDDLIDDTISRSAINTNDVSYGIVSTNKH